jgi:hypothetical protein
MTAKTAVTTMSTRQHRATERPWDTCRGCAGDWRIPGASVAVDQLMALVPLDLGFSNVTWEGAAIASPIALIMHVVPSAVLLASIMITVDALELHSLARLAQSSNPAT